MVTRDSDVIALIHFNAAIRTCIAPEQRVRRRRRGSRSEQDSSIRCGFVVSKFVMLCMDLMMLCWLLLVLEVREAMSRGRREGRAAFNIVCSIYVK